MTLDQIKNAVRSGQRVYWSNQGYEVIQDNIGQWLIIWKRGELGEHCIGLTWQDNITMNGKPEQFFTT